MCSDVCVGVSVFRCVVCMCDCGLRREIYPKPLQVLGKREGEPTGPRCCLMQNHWSFIWVSIIQQESSHPL